MDNKQKLNVRARAHRALARTFIILFILFTISILGTTSFASDWNFEKEKEMYENLGNLIMYNNNSVYAKNPKLFEENFINNLFSQAESKFESSSYSQTNFKYTALVFYNSEIAFCVCPEIDYPNTILSSYLLLRVSLNSDYSISSVSDVINAGSNTYKINIFSNGNNYPDSFLLTVDTPTSLNTIENSNIPYYSANNKHGLTYSSEEILKIDKKNSSNSVIINKEYDVGFNYNADIKYYYYLNNQKTYITEYIDKNTYDYWWGKNEAPFITLNNIQNLPVGTYYADYVFTLKNDNFNNYSYSETKEVFRIVENDDEEIIPSGDTGGGTGGDTGGGITTPDYNPKLDNIQGSLDNIKENIPTSGDVQNIISGETQKIKDTIAGEYSGEINMTSGEILNNMGYNPPNDPNQSIWDTLIKGLEEALTGTGNVTYEFEFRGKKYSIQSEDIKQPEGALKTYTGLVINFILLMQMVTFIKKCIDQVAEGDLKVMHTADADCYFF